MGHLWLFPFTSNHKFSSPVKSTRASGVAGCRAGWQRHGPGPASQKCGWTVSPRPQFAELVTWTLGHVGCSWKGSEQGTFPSWEPAPPRLEPAPIRSAEVGRLAGSWGAAVCAQHRQRACEFLQGFWSPSEREARAVQIMKGVPEQRLCPQRCPAGAPGAFPGCPGWSLLPPHLIL